MQKKYIFAKNKINGHNFECNIIKNGRKKLRKKPVKRTSITRFSRTAFDVFVPSF